MYLTLQREVLEENKKTMNEKIHGCGSIFHWWRKVRIRGEMTDVRYKILNIDQEWAMKTLVDNDGITYPEEQFIVEMVEKIRSWWIQKRDGIRLWMYEEMMVKTNIIISKLSQYLSLMVPLSGRHALLKILKVGYWSQSLLLRGKGPWLGCRPMLLWGGSMREQRQSIFIDLRARWWVLWSAEEAAMIPSLCARHRHFNMWKQGCGGHLFYSLCSGEETETLWLIKKKIPESSRW